MFYSSNVPVMSMRIGYGMSLDYKDDQHALMQIKFKSRKFHDLPKNNISTHFLTPVTPGFVVLWGQHYGKYHICREKIQLSRAKPVNPASNNIKDKIRLLASYYCFWLRVIMTSDLRGFKR